MNRTRFEENLIRNAEQAHALCAARGVPAIVGVPAYLTGHAVGSLLLGASIVTSVFTGGRLR